jgi:hypothetical protein
MSELEKRLKAYDDADKKIRDETGTGDINEICQKYSNLKETKEKLESEMRSLEILFENLKHKKDYLTRELNKLKFQGEKSISTKQIEENELLADRALKQCEESRSNLKIIEKLLVDIIAGTDTIMLVLKNKRVNILN